MNAARRLALVALAVGLASMASAVRAQDGRRAALVFSDVTVLDGVGGTSEAATVVVANGRIGGTAPDGARTISVPGAVLAPGFVEPAARLGYASEEAEVTREMTAFVSARDLANPRHQAFREAAREGCTTVVLVPGPRNVVGGLSQAFHAWSTTGRAVPIRGAPSSLHAALSRYPSLGNFPPRYGPTTSIYARRPTTRMGVVWLLRQTFLAAKGVQEPPNEADLTPYQDVLAGRRPLRVSLHRMQDVNAVLRLADEVGMKLALDNAEEAYLRRDELAKRGVPVVVGPIPDIRTGAGPDNTDTALMNATMLHEAGVKVALTAGNTGGRWLREQGMFAVRYGMTSDEALAALTSVPADLCGLSDRGRIAEGAHADVVLWSGHPLKPTSRMLMVVIDGSVVFDRTGKDN